MRFEFLVRNAVDVGSSLMQIDDVGEDGRWLGH
jgi:hypothetical protein